MREAQARSRAVHLAPSRGDARDRGGGAAGGGAGSLSLSCGPTLGTRASGRAMRAMRAGDVGRITPRHARRMWPPRPRGRWRRPACRRRGPGASSWDRGCAQAWLGCRVDIGSIEALVRLGSLYDTLATHRRLPQKQPAYPRKTTALSGLCQVLRSLTDRNRTSPTEQ